MGNVGSIPLGSLFKSDREANENLGSNAPREAHYSTLPEALTAYRGLRLAAAPLRARFPDAISHVGLRDIEEWLRKLTVGLVARNNLGRHLITLFNFARRRGYLPRDREKWREKPKLKSNLIEIFTMELTRARAAMTAGFVGSSLLSFLKTLTT